MDAEMSAERPSHRYENKQILIDAIMNQLGITEVDLENDPSWIKSKLREANIEKVLN